MDIVDISDRLFVTLFIPGFFASMGVFFWGVNCLWRTSIENRELRRKADARGGS